MNGVTFGLLSGEIYAGDDELATAEEEERLLLDVRMRDGGGMTIVAREADGEGGFREIFRGERPRDFFQSRQHVGEIGNKIRDAATLPPSVDEQDVKDGFEEACRWLDKQAEEADAATTMKPPSVEQVLDDTERVEAFIGSPTVFTVTLARDGEQTQLELNEHQLLSEGQNLLVSRYMGVFLESLELSKDDWTMIRDVWLDMAERVGEERQTEMDDITDRVLRYLERTINVVADPADYKSGRHAALYDVENSAGDKDVAHHPDGGPDADVLWVKSAAISEALDEAKKSSSIISELSKKLNDRGAVYTGSKKKLGAGRAYPFDPDALGKSRESIPTDDGPEVEP